MLKVSIKKQLQGFNLDTTFDVKQGIIGILGPSGSGKSMTLQAISGLLTPDEGMIILDDKVLFNKERKINVPTRNRNVGYVFQNYALFPHLTVEENIAYGLKGLDIKKIKQKVHSILAAVQLEGYSNRYPSQLSGGQKQRIALARTLVTEPSILLLDEPFSALDRHVKQLLEKELLALIKDHFRGTVLFVTHNIEEAYRICDYIMLYDQGRIIQYGEKAQVLERPRTKRAAQIVDCKNIFDIDSFEEMETHSLFTINGMKLYCDEKSPSRRVALGIHASSIMFTEDMNMVNTFAFEVATVTENISSTLLTVRCRDLVIEAEVKKELVTELLHGSMYIHLPPEKLFIIET